MESTGTNSSGGGGLVGAAGMVAAKGASPSVKLDRGGIEDIINQKIKRENESPKIDIMIASCQVAP